MPSWKKVITSGSDACLNSLSVSTTVTSSGAFFSGSVVISTSGSTVFDVQGSQGQLFSITDSLSGSLFSVNDISGLPILEVFSNDCVVMGTYGSNALVVSGSTVSAACTIQATSSYANNADCLDGCQATDFYLASNPDGFTDCTGTVTGTGVANNVAYWTATGEIAADEGSLYWDPSSNELGIGTGTPGAQLHIYRNDTSTGPSLRIEQDGSGDALMQFVMTGANLWNVGIDNSNDDALTFARGTFSTGLETLVLKSTNVGIGNTNPPEALTVEGNISSSGDLTIDGDSTIDGNLTVGGTITAQEFKTELVSASIIYQSGSTKFGDTSDDVHSFSGSLRVTGSGDHYFTNGNVGIGTTSPVEKLQVEGTINSEGLLVTGNASQVFETGSGNTQAQFYVDLARSNRTLHIKTEQTSVGDPVDAISFNSMYTNTAAPVSMLFRTGTNNTLTVASNDRVGIGTISPGALLDVDGNSIFRGSAVFNEDSADVDFRVESNGNANMLFVDGGNDRVGIGTNSPQRTLHAAGTGIIISPSSGNAVLQFQDSGVTNAYIQLTDSTQRMDFKDDSDTVMSVNYSTLNVGIGTTSPSQALTVEGNISGSGTLVIDGNTTLGNATSDLHIFNGDIVQNISAVPTLLGAGRAVNFDGAGSNLYFIASQNGNTGGWLNTLVGATSAYQVYKSTGCYIFATSTTVGGSGGLSTKAAFDGSGNFGIGSSALPPSALLDVGGTLNASGNVTFDSNLTVDTNTLHVDSSGNYVGIGTNSPTEKLTVDGRLLLTGSTPVLRFNHSETQIYGTTNAGAGVNMFYEAAANHFFTGSIILRSNNNLTLRNIGEGDYAQIRNDGTGTDNILAFRTTTSERMRITESELVVNEFSQDYDFRVESNNNANMLFVDGGNDRVGIGTNAPEYRLDVGGNTLSNDNTVRISPGNGGTALRVVGNNNDVTLLRVSSTTSTDSGSYGFSLRYMGSRSGNNNSLSIFSDNENVNPQTEAFTLLQDGKLGIGTNTPAERLTVDGNAEVSGSIISPNFSAGLLGGDGYRLALSDAVGCTALEVDNLLVRGRLSVVEFLAQQIRATNGTLFVTSTGKVETVTTSGTAPSFLACITTPTGSNHGFAVNDRIRAQRFDGFGNVYQSDLTVTAVPNPFAFTASYQDACFEPQPGFEYVRLGNSSDTDRQGGIILSSDLDDSPYIKIYDEVDEHNDIFIDANTKVLVGNLSSHKSTTFGCLSGSGGSPNYGFYASGSAYLEGSINATGGEIGGITICNTSISASNGGFEIKSDGSATFASGQITFESDGDITSNEYLVERSRVFGDGSDGNYTVCNTFSSVAGLFNVSSGTGHTVCLLRDAYFCNLTIDGTSGCWVCVVTNGYRMFVKDTLTLETYGFVRNEGADGNNGNNAFGCIPGSGGSGGSGTNTGTLLGGTNGGAGGQGGGEEP